MVWALFGDCFLGGSRVILKIFSDRFPFSRSWVCCGDMRFWSLLGFSRSGDDVEGGALSPLGWEVVQFGETVLEFLETSFRYWIFCLPWFAVG